jgi:predicted site-specific integrase-resolvase
MTPKRELTVREFAEKEQVDQRTVRRWIDKGAVDVRRTPGGGLRILASPHDKLGHPNQ